MARILDFKFVSAKFKLVGNFINGLTELSLLEEPLIMQPLMNFPPFYETRKFNPVFTRALHS
jgi:hypothetical protein